MNPLWLAISKLRRGKLDDSIQICDELLAQNNADQAAWFIKCKAVIKQNYIDDVELDEEGVAEALLDENAVASMPRLSILLNFYVMTIKLLLKCVRPGTSLSAPQTSAKGSGVYDQGTRPVSQSGTNFES